jgi:hypothetical protein
MLFPGHLSPDLTPLQFCFLGSVKDTIYLKEMNELRERIVQIAGCITNKIFANPGKNCISHLSALCPLMVSIPRSTENIIKLHDMQCLKMLSISSTNLVTEAI